MTSAPKKRKRIDDFFVPVKSIIDPQKTPNLLESISRITKDDRFNEDLAEKTFVPGLSLYKNFITPEEEATILNFLRDPSRCTWRTDLSRRTMHFGGTYCLMPSKTDPKPQILQAPPIPPELAWLIQRMVSAHIFHTNQVPQYCIVNEYTDDLGISAHTENFQFGEPVVGLSLLCSCPIRFHELTSPFDGSVRSGKAGKAERSGRKEDVVLPGRSLLVMRGESRWKWQHEIVRSSRGRGVGWKRVSLTFRYKDDQKNIFNDST